MASFDGSEAACEQILATEFLDSHALGGFWRSAPRENLLIAIIEVLASSSAISASRVGASFNGASLWRIRVLNQAFSTSVMRLIASTNVCQPRR